MQEHGETFQLAETPYLPSAEITRIVLNFSGVSASALKCLDWKNLPFRKWDYEPTMRLVLLNDDLRDIRARRRVQFERVSDDHPLRNADATGLDHLSASNWDAEDFTNCDLREVNMRSCTFNGANFQDADLWGAIYEEAIYPAHKSTSTPARRDQPEPGQTSKGD
jgi:uncharacterized protein YjbI with pentapeptide repeats